MKNFTKQFKTIEQIFLVFLFSIFLNLNLHSQTSGPTAPDFKGFTPINNNNLVNEFDGSFNYSIPVLSLPSGTKEVFNMALTYRSGMSPNEDASWVGFGWNLNPGIIQRQLKGFPDDFKNADVIFINAIMPSLTAFKTTSANIEYLSRDEKVHEIENDDPPPFSGKTYLTEQDHATSKVNVNFSIKQSFNNRTGSYINYNTGASGFGLGGSFGADSRGNVNLGASVNLLQMCSYLDMGIDLLRQDEECKSTFFSNLASDYTNTITAYNLSSGMLNLGGVSSIYSGNSWGKGQYPLNINDYDYTHYEVALKGQLRYLMIGSELGLKDLSEGKEILRYKNIQKRTVSGYLHTESSANNSNVILDYYNENESGLSPRNKYLPIPFQNSDNFNVSGFGIGGTFRFDKNQAQMFRPISNSRLDNSNIGSITAGYDFTSQSILLGADINSNLKSMSVDQWDETKDKDEPSKNIAEIGGLPNKVYYDDNIARFSGDLTNSISNYNINNATVKNAFNPLSTQIDVNFLNSHELNVTNIDGYTKDVNNNKVIDRNSFIRTKYNGDEIIGFEITSAEGHKYYYDLPIQNSKEGNLQYVLKDVYKDIGNKNNIMFSEDGKILYLEGSVKETLPNILIDKVNSSTSETTYVRDAIDEGYNIYKPGNNLNKYVTGKFTSKSYNSAFLLTKIEMSNYMSVKDYNSYSTLQTKPTIEDIGDYVIFNYRPAYNGTEKLQWREPYKGLTYNKGQLSSAIDEVGSMMFGQKDLYYLESIETKTHVAVFVTNLSSFNKTDNNNIHTNNYNKTYVVKGNTFSTDIQSLTDEVTKFKFSEIANKLNGSGEKRKDCLPALVNEELALRKGINEEDQLNSSKIQYLEKVLLFTKDLSKRGNAQQNENNIYLSELLNTVNFVYDKEYPIWNNMPNSVIRREVYNQTIIGNYGKLTLKGVYTENEYVSENKSNPYLFAYKYTNEDISNIADNITTNDNKDKFNKNYLSLNSGSTVTSKDQTPNFNYWNIDKWNNYNDILRSGIPMVPFQLNNNHSIFKHSDNFDPSAWNLKKITNPSKSEILALYEENEYSHVQNRHATVMFNKIEQINSDQKSFKISKSDIEATLNISLTDPNDLVRFWQNELMNEQVYYKFYFKLLNDNSFNTESHNLGNDYITGYNKLIKIEYDASVPNNEFFKFEFDNSLPFKKCKNFVKNLDGMIFNDGNNILTTNLDYKAKFFDSFEGISGVQPGLKDEIPSIFKGALKGDYDCQNYSSNLSYLKLPIPDYLVKKGGGIRVKAIVNMDKFIPENENITNIVLNKPQITGSEYIYKTKLNNEIGKNYSSGVASNEPDLGREENALLKRISVLDDEDHSNIEASVTTQFGLTKNIKPEEFNDEDMILGESILSAPSISYSKIFVKQIDFNNDLGYKSKSLIVKEFYTSKDIPFDIKVNIYNNQAIEGQSNEIYNTKINKQSAVSAVGVTKISKKDNVDWYSNLMNMQPLPFKITGDNYSFTQNYQFILTNMNGKLKHTSTYSYNDLNDEESWNLGTQTKYEYFDIAEPVAIIDKKEDLLLAEKANDYKYDWLGMRSVINVENRTVSTTNYSGSLDFDLGISLVGIPTSYSISPSLNMKSETYNYFVTNKIIELYPQVKKIINIKDGIITEVENLAFDGKTGKPVLQKTTSNYSEVEVEGNSKNEFYSYEILAHQEYKNLGNISNNEGILFRSDAKSEENTSFLPILTYSLKKDDSSTPNDPADDKFYIRTSVNHSSSHTVYSNYNVCQIKDLIKPGDEISIIIKSGSVSDEMPFLVESVDCYIIKLRPLSSLNLAINQLYFDLLPQNEREKIDFVITKSAYKNNLSTTISKSNFFNPQLSSKNNLPINMFKREELNYNTPLNYAKSNSDWSFRENVVSDLNNTLNSILVSNDGIFNTNIIGSDFEGYKTTEISTMSPVPITLNLGLISPGADNVNHYNGSSIVLNYKYRFYNLSSSTSTSINESLGNTTYPFIIMDTNYTVSKPLHKIKIGDAEYVPKYFNFGLKIDNRYNNLFSSSVDLSANQIFGGVVYKCLNCSTLVPQPDMYLQPHFELDENGNITYKNYWVDPGCYLLNLKKYDISTNILLSEVTKTMAEFETYYSGNNEVLDKIKHFNNSYGKKIEWLNAQNYSLNLEVLDFNKKLQKNLISTNNVQGATTNFISSNAITFEKLNIDSLDFKYNDIDNNIHVPQINNINLTDINNNNSISERLNNINKVAFKSKFENNLFNNKQFNYYTDLKVFENQNDIDYNSVINNRFVGTTFINEGTVKDVFRIFNWVDENQNSTYNQEFEILKSNYNFVPSLSKNKENVLTSIAYDDYLNILPNHLSQNLPSDLSFYQNFENYNLQFAKNDYPSSFGYYNNKESITTDAFTGNYAFKLKIVNSSISNPEIKHYVHFLPNYIETKLIDFNSAILENKNVIIEAWVKYDIENKETFIDNNNNTPSYDEIINNLKNIKLKFNIFKDNESTLSLSDLNLNKFNPITVISTPLKLYDNNFEIIQQVGEWYLVRANINEFLKDLTPPLGNNDLLRFSISTFLSGSIVTSNTDIHPYIIVDDIRFFYQDANITSYVYDYEKMRISAILDNNHIPLKYVYNSNSEMNKIKLSSITGEKTVKESHLNVKKTFMNDLHYKSNSTLEFNSSNTPSSMIINQENYNEEINVMEDKFNSEINNHIHNLQDSKIEQNNQNELKEKLNSNKKQFSRSALLKKNLLNDKLNKMPTKEIESPKINESIKIDLFKKDTLTNDK